jgi:hypothetical protein
MSDKKAFWKSLPGLITGVATVVGTVATVVPLLISRNNQEDGQRRLTPTPSAISSPSPSPPTSSLSPFPEETASSPSPSSPKRSPSPESPSSQAGLIVSPKRAEFEKVIVGTRSQPLTIRLISAGPMRLRIEATRIDGEDREAFEIEEETTSCRSGMALAPQEDCEIRIRFAPRSTGDFHATLLVESSSPDTPKTVPLTGTGAIL